MSMYVVVAEIEEEQYILCQELKENVQVFRMKSWDINLCSSDIFVSWTDNLDDIFKFIKNLNDFIPVDFDIDPNITEKLITLEAKYNINDDKVYIL